MAKVIDPICMMLPSLADVDRSRLDLRRRSYPPSKSHRWCEAGRRWGNLITVQQVSGKDKVVMSQ